MVGPPPAPHAPGGRRPCSNPLSSKSSSSARGLRIDPSCEVDADGRRISRTRAGLGSGLELVLPSPRKKIWVTCPSSRAFAAKSPFLLMKTGRGYVLCDSRQGDHYPVEIPEEPVWYSWKTSSGVEMSRVGVLQGTYLGIYVSNACLYWNLPASPACALLHDGPQRGQGRGIEEKVEDVIEVAKAARDESGSIFTHLNTGYHFEDRDDLEVVHGLRQCEPFVKRLRAEVGGFIGVQAVPVPRRKFNEYDDLIAAGTDHFSFCYQFEDPAYFAKICPGKEMTLGQNAFFEAMEYTAKKLGPGKVSGEIIAGLEPLEATMRGIDRIVNAGAFPTVRIFRPTIGSALESAPPPSRTRCARSSPISGTPCGAPGSPWNPPGNPGVARRPARGSGRPRAADVLLAPLRDEARRAAHAREAVRRVEAPPEELDGRRRLEDRPWPRKAPRL